MNHANYPADWEKRRRNVFERDGFECQNCGYRSPVEHDKARGLHAHHQKKISDGGGHGLDNLITVCKDCHVEVHSKKGVDEIPAPDFHECAYDGCDEVRGKWGLHNGGYCTAQCEFRDKAEEALEVLGREESFCSRCFANWSPEFDCCPNCGNWAPDNESGSGDVEFDRVNFAAHIIHQAGQKDLFRE